jgi:hypothetical protein
MTNYYSPLDIAEYCNVTHSAVSQWINRGKIPEPAITSVGGHARLWSEDQVVEIKKDFLARKPRGLYASTPQGVRG